MGIDKYRDLDPQGDSAAKLQSIYAEWADKYDLDNDDKLGTVSQPTMVALFADHCPDRNVQIMDVGCGTGLVGHHLGKAGFTTFDGTDISPEMMAYAGKHGYRQLLLMQAGKPIAVADESYGASLCVGVFTHAHLGPEGFDELLRITRPSGVIGFTVNEGVWQSGGFPETIQRHCDKNRWSILLMEYRPYMVKEGVKAWYVLARKR